MWKEGGVGGVALRCCGRKGRALEEAGTHWWAHVCGGIAQQRWVVGVVVHLADAAVVVLGHEEGGAVDGNGKATRLVEERIHGAIEGAC